VTLVARNGRIVHLKAQGVTDVDSKRPMQKDSVFRIASMSKPVAAVAVLMLMEEGKVRLDDPVSKYLPAYRNMKVAVTAPRTASVASGAGGGPVTLNFFTVPAEREITVLDILTHTSGLMSGASSNAGGQAAFNRRHEIGLKWIDNLGVDAALEFQPGTRWDWMWQRGLLRSSPVRLSTNFCAPACSVHWACKTRSSGRPMRSALAS
jgi:CubicO group peptidase (beta-lactamase class C family)